MKTLIVYYSLEGFTKSMAEKLAQKSGADILALHPVKNYPSEGAKKFLVGGKAVLTGDKPKLQPYAFNAEKYDRIVIGSPVWASSFAPPLRTFVEENFETLKSKKIGVFFCQLGNGAGKAAEKFAKLLKNEYFEFVLTFTEPNKKNSHPENDKIIEETAELLKSEND